MSSELETGKRKRITELVCICVFALLGSIGVTGITSGSNVLTYTNSFFAVLFFGVNLFLISRIWSGFVASALREKVISAVLAVTISTALHLGAQFESTDSAELAAKSMVICTLALAIYLIPVLNACFETVKKAASKKKDDTRNEKQLNLFKTWGMIFALWIPTFLAMFPGAFVYDATDEYNEVLNGIYSTHHPLIHVITLGGLVRGAEVIGLHANAGIALYTILQMLVVSLIFAYVICKVNKWGMSSFYCKVCVGIVGLFPVFTMYSVCTAKDTLFSACFLMVVICLTDYVKERRVGTLFVAVSVLMMLLRNNGVYAYLVSIPFIALFIMLTDKNNIKSGLKLVALMLCSVLIYKGCDRMLVYALDASDNEHQEMLTVPIQQLARVYNYSADTFSEEDLSLLKEFIPENYLITYNSKISDVLKSGFNNEIYEEKGSAFVKLWIKTGLKKPFIYVNAWLANNYGYWYPDAVIDGYKGLPMYTFTYGDSSYFGFETEPPGERHSLIPVYEEFYRNISLEMFQQKVPVVSMLFSPGFVFYVFLFALFYLLREKKYRFLACMIPILLLWATVLLGPTVLVRYVLILWYIWPVLPIYLLGKEND